MNAAQELAVEFELPNRFTPAESEALDRGALSRLAPGQTVFVSHDYNRAGPFKSRVEKVGRKWVHLAGQQRAALGSRAVDGGGRLWLSLEEYHAEQARQAAWTDFKRDVDRLWRAPAGVTPEAIHAARAWLGLVTP